MSLTSSFFLLISNIRPHVALNSQHPYHGRTMPIWKELEEKSYSHHENKFNQPPALSHLEERQTPA